MSLTAYIRTFFFNCVWLSVLFFSSPWLVWRAVAQGKNRRGWKQKLFGLVPRSNRESGGKRIWLHAVSVGEVHVLKTLIDELLAQRDDVQLFISTTTETGFDRANELFGEQHQVFFFPFDFSWAIRNVMARIQPTLLVLAELELWPNLIHLAADYGLPVMVANGRLSKKSYVMYRRFGFVTRPMFGKLTCVASQTPAYADRFVGLGCDSENVTVTGNLKYDSVETDRNNSKSEWCRGIAIGYGFKNDDKVFVAGSTQIEDEIAAVDAWLALREPFSELKLILVPRHPDRIKEIESLLAKNDLKANRRSKSDSIESDILIVDVIGELSGWWGLADVAFVGGSMGSRGGQNMIEPAAYGVPVCFGPNTANFKETVDGLLACKAARVVRDADDLSGFVAEMLNSPIESEAIGTRARKYVSLHQGAAGRTVEIVNEFVSTGGKRHLGRAA